MNFKTSVLLCFVLIVVLAGFFLVRSGHERAVEPEPPKSPTADLMKPLFDEEPQDVVMVSCTKGDLGPWRFERAPKDDGDELGEWRLVEPVEAKVTAYMVEGIVNRLKGLKYQVKYVSGQADGVSPEQAGLKPPRVVVEMKQKDGTAYAVHIGKPASNRQTYVGLSESDDVYLAQSSLDNLLRDRVEEYRDKVMFDFDATNAVDMTVTHDPADGEPVLYRLARDERDGWVFEAPFDADADDDAVSAATRAMARLRASEWITSDDSADLARFGLRPPELDIEVTCQVTTQVPAETEEAAEDGEGEEPSEPEMIEKTETHHHHLQVAARGPLGKENQVYARLGDTPSVAAIAKSTADELIPNIDEWRNMKVVRADVSGATKIRIQSGDEPAVTLIRAGGSWAFEDEGGPADDEAVNQLIKKVNELRAVAFVDSADTTDASFGLATPAAEILFTLPGREAPERVTVGGPTDEAAKRLHYVRYGESTSIAKVRSDDVRTLKRSTLAYENRQITNLPVSDIESIDLTRPNGITGKPEAITLERQPGQSWRITMPIEGQTDPTTVTVMVAALANFRAESVVARRTSGPQEYRFDAPTASATISYRDLPEPAPAESTEPQDLTPQLRMFTVEFVDIGHTIHARRSDKPTIFKVRRADYAPLLEEFNDKTIWSIDETKLAAVSITSSGATHRFERRDEQWIYGPEPDLPIDHAKVDDLVKSIRDLKIDRYVAYGVDDLAEFGLLEPERTIRVETDDQQTFTLAISESPCAGGRRKTHCAILQGNANVFSLTSDDVSEFDIRIEEFERLTDS